MQHTFRTACATAGLLVLLLPAFVMADTGEPFLQNPIACDNLLCVLIQIINFFLGGVAVVATAMFVYGGILFLTSAGNAEMLKKGKDTILWASIGIVTILGSWIAIRFILVGFAKTT